MQNYDFVIIAPPFTYYANCAINTVDILMNLRAKAGTEVKEDIIKQSNGTLMFILLITDLLLTKGRCFCVKDTKQEEIWKQEWLFWA